MIYPGTCDSQIGNEGMMGEQYFRAVVNTVAWPYLAVLRFILRDPSIGRES